MPVPLHSKQFCTLPPRSAEGRSGERTTATLQVEEVKVMQIAERDSTYTDSGECLRCVGRTATSARRSVLSGLHVKKHPISNVLPAFSRPDILRSKKQWPARVGGRALALQGVPCQHKHAEWKCGQSLTRRSREWIVQGAAKERQLTYSLLLLHTRPWIVVWLTEGKKWHLDLPVFRHSVLPRCVLCYAV